LLKSDWFAGLGQQRFAAIICNPPYVAEQDVNLARNVARFEPANALFSGSEGLAAIEAIISQASEFLIAPGWLMIEHSWQQATQVLDLFNKAGFGHGQNYPDLVGHPRVSMAKCFF